MSHAPSYPRQTQRYLQELFAKRGIATRSRLGQNFLIDLNLQKLIVDTARLTPNDVVLEVGTGTGSLTAQLSAFAAEVITVEIDSRMVKLAHEVIDGLPNVTLLHQDALKNKNHLAPEVLELIAERLAEVPGRRLKLVANLPYNVSVPVLLHLLALLPSLERGLVMVQSEVADRLAVPIGVLTLLGLAVLALNLFA